MERARLAGKKHEPHPGNITNQQHHNPMFPPIENPVIQSSLKKIGQTFRKTQTGQNIRK